MRIVSIPRSNKLFIQTEALPEQRALLAHHRQRSDGDPPIYIAQPLYGGAGPDEDLRFETDSRRFIGRGRTLARPMGALQTPGNSQDSYSTPS